MIGNLSGGQDANDLAMNILRIATDPEATKARLLQLREADSSIIAQRDALAKDRAALDVDAKRVAERERVATQREFAAGTTEARQNARAAELQKQGILNHERAAALTAKEEKLNQDARAFAVRVDKYTADQQALEALRAELVRLKTDYETKLAKLRDITG